MGKSKIEWTEMTWNPVTGCTRISPGCQHCYAERMAKRLAGRCGYPKAPHHFDLMLHPERLELPLKWKRPRTIFVCSMSDLFHRAIPKGFLFQIFDVMNRAGWHRYQILTKRPWWMLDYKDALSWESHMWMGVSVEDSYQLWRVEQLLKSKAWIKFVSFEPLLGPLPDLALDGIDWVIVGGESGPGARPMEPAWVIDIRDQCIDAGIPFFFKQWGGVNKKKAGRLLEGRTWNEMPAWKDEERRAKGDEV